jgi:hypothetical protein
VARRFGSVRSKNGVYDQNFDYSGIDSTLVVLGGNVESGLQG